MTAQRGLVRANSPASAALNCKLRFSSSMALQEPTNDKISGVIQQHEYQSRVNKIEEIQHRLAQV